MDGHLLKLKCKNIVIFWDTDLWLSLDNEIDYSSKEKNVSVLLYM